MEVIRDSGYTGSFITDSLSARVAGSVTVTNTSVMPVLYLQHHNIMFMMLNVDSLSEAVQLTNGREISSTFSGAANGFAALGLVGSSCIYDGSILCPSGNCSVFV